MTSGSVPDISEQGLCLRVFERDPGGIPSLGRQFWHRLDWPVDRSCLKLDWMGRLRLVEPRLHEPELSSWLARAVIRRVSRQ